MVANSALAMERVKAELERGKEGLAEIYHHPFKGISKLQDLSLNGAVFAGKAWITCTLIMGAMTLWNEEAREALRNVIRNSDRN